MDIKEVEERMCSIAQEIIDDSSERISALPQNAQLEIKAQKIRRNMAGICKAFAAMQYNQKNPMPIRRRMVSDLTNIEQDCSDEEITYLHALLRIENIFLQKYAEELKTAKHFNDDEDIFKLETQIDVIKHITEKWRQFGKKEGFNNEY